jgi:hypothetical protein
MDIVPFSCSECRATFGELDGGICLVCSRLLCRRHLVVGKSGAICRRCLKTQRARGKTNKAPADSAWWLAVDLLSAKVLVWVASVGRDAQLTPGAHLYFFDRYRRLAQYHRTHGRPDKATRLQSKADEHYRAGGGVDGPPYAAAMAMPRPSQFIRTEAVSRNQFDSPDDAA